MGALVPRPIEWIESAPIKIEGVAKSGASPAQVFAVLADHERWSEWFPSVRRVTVLGPAAGIGARRRVAIPGATVDEEFIAWEPGARWAFTGIAAQPPFTKSLIEDCRLTALDGGGTAISYTMYLDPPRALRPVVRASASLVRRNLNKALRALALRAIDAPA